MPSEARRLYPTPHLALRISSAPLFLRYILCNKLVSGSQTFSRVFPAKYSISEAGHGTPRFAVDVAECGQLRAPCL